MAKLYKTRRRREVAGVKIAKVFRIRDFKGRLMNILDFFLFISNPLPSRLRGFSASNMQMRGSIWFLTALGRRLWTHPPVRAWPCRSTFASVLECDGADLSRDIVFGQSYWTPSETHARRIGLLRLFPCEQKRILEISYLPC